MKQASKVEIASTSTEHKWLAKKYGINGIPLLNCISFPSLFLFDFMHLIWQNLIPNLIEFWTASFKDLTHAGRDYVIEQHVWEEVGAAIAASGATILSAFGALVPDIATK